MRFVDARPGQRGRKSHLWPPGGDAGQATSIAWSITFKYLDIFRHMIWNPHLHSSSSPKECWAGPVLLLAFYHLPCPATRAACYLMPPSSLPPQDCHLLTFCPWSSPPLFSPDSGVRSIQIDLYIFKSLCCKACTSLFQFVLFLFTLDIQVLKKKKKKRKLPSDVNEGKTVFIRYDFLSWKLLFVLPS